MYGVEIPTVRQWMSRPRLILSPATDIFDAIDDLVEAGVTAASVVEEGGGLVGILTEKDCLRVMSSSIYDSQSAGGSVSDYMSPLPDALSPAQDIFGAAEQFLKGNFPTLPVVEDGRLVGRLSRQEMLRCIQAFNTEVAKKRDKLGRQLADGGDRPSSIEKMQQTAARTTPQGLAKIFSRNRGQ